MIVQGLGECYRWSLRIILAYILFGLLGIGAVFSQTLNLAIEQASGSSSGSYNLLITTSRPDGVGALEVELVFNAMKLEFDSVSAGPLLANAMFDYKVISPGRVRVDLISNTPIEKEGVLFIAKLRVLEPGSTMIQIENSEAWTHSNLHEMGIETHSLELIVSRATRDIIFSKSNILIGIVMLVMVLIAFVVGRRSSKKQS
ncbi:MAG: hypothetical protein KJO91_08590 [Gammaproteobacteria bacterium]|nr:hypothetical protein [Gammaproteobacteria bacterium]